MTKLKTLLACFAVILLFSCSDDDKNNNEIKLQKPKITREEFKYFKKLPNLIPKKKGNVSSKNSASEIYEFTIDSTSVTQISYQDKNYFTIAIHRNENLNENSFENLVIVEDLINHNNNAFIIKYFPNDEYFQNLQTTKYPGFKGEITIHKIDYNLIGLSYRSDLCITYTQAFCGNNFGPAGPNCYNNQDHGAHIYYKTIEVCSSRSDVPVIVDITDGAGSGFVSGINGGGGSHGTNNSNNLITEPIIMQNRTEQKLLQSFTTIEQNNWWQFVASQETKVQIINYLNQNTTNNVIAPQAVEFVNEAINSLINGGEVDFENEIILEPSFVNNIKIYCAYTKLKSTNEFQDLLANFMSDDALVKLKFKVAPNLTCGTNPSGCTGFDSSTGIATITISEEHINSYKDTGIPTPMLFLCETILHESIHANLFYYQYLETYNLPPINNEFVDLYEFYRNSKDWQHNYIASQYVNTIVAGLNNVHPLIGDESFINNTSTWPNWDWSSAHEALVWPGLIGTIQYNEYMQNNGSNWNDYYTQTLSTSTSTPNCN